MSPKEAKKLIDNKMGGAKAIWSKLDRWMRSAYKHGLGARPPKGNCKFPAIKRALAPECRLYFEIGVGFGGSLLNVLQDECPCDYIGLGDLRLYGKKRNRSHHKTKEELTKILAANNPHGHRVTLIEGDSHDESIRKLVFETIGNRGVDLLLIDGDHSEDGTILDYEWYGPLVGKNGIIIFDDYKSKAWPEVTDAVDRLDFGDRGTLEWNNTFIVLPEGR